MHSKYLSVLTCPFCNSPFHNLKIEAYENDDKESIRFGCIECACDTFPIYEGILILKRDQKIAVSAIKGHHYRKAFIFLNDLRKISRRVFQFLQPIVMHVGQKEQHLSGLLAFCLSVMKWTALNKFEFQWFGYLANRERKPTFILQLLSESSIINNQTILDIGTGGAHIVRYLDKKFKNLNWYLIDEKFWLLLLLKSTNGFPKRFCPIIFDIKTKFPFQSNIFDRVLANDCLLHLDYPKDVFSEINRVTKESKGMVFSMHNHHPNGHNIPQCNGLDPHLFIEWLGLPFTNYSSDKKLLTHMRAGKTIQLNLIPKKKMKLKQYNSYSLIAGFKPNQISFKLNSKFRKFLQPPLEDID